MVPHKQGSYEYRYMQVKEESDGTGAYVSFGPAAMDVGIYRVAIYKRVSKSGKVLDLDGFAPQAVEGYKKQFEADGGSIQELSNDQTLMAGHMARHKVWQQIVPAGSHAGGFSNAATTYLYDVYVIHFNDAVAIVCVQTASLGSTTLFNETPASVFAESVTVP